MKECRQICATKSIFIRLGSSECPTLASVEASSYLDGRVGLCWTVNFVLFDFLKFKYVKKQYMLILNMNSELSAAFFICYEHF